MSAMQMLNELRVCKKAEAEAEAESGRETATDSGLKGQRRHAREQCPRAMGPRAIGRQAGKLRPDGYTDRHGTRLCNFAAFAAVAGAVHVYLVRKRVVHADCSKQHFVANQKVLPAECNLCC